MNHIIAATLIERDGKYLLVQEGQNHADKCKGKWNVPGGHVDAGETILDGAIREALEETGCKVELSGICQLGTEASSSSALIAVVFLARGVGLVDDFSSAEISATGWFTYEEICAMSEQLRCPELTIGAVENARNGLITPLSLVKVYPPKYLD